MSEGVIDNMAGLGEGLGSENPDVPFKMPTKEELLDMLDDLGLGDAEKEELRAALLSGDPSEMFAPIPFWTSQAFVLIVFSVFMSSIFAFFGYKLYKSLKDKEVKREEKRKMKQMKKKK